MAEVIDEDRFKNILTMPQHNQKKHKTVMLLELRKSDKHQMSLSIPQQNIFCFGAKRSLDMF